MGKQRPPQEMKLSDAEVRDVIERAVRTQPQRSNLTVAELREIAAELDIDPHALELALDQVVGLPIPGKPIRSWIKRQMTKIGRLTDAFLPQTGRIAGFAIFGAVAGWLNSFMATLSINVHYPVALAMVGLTIANLLSRRLDQKLRRFITETLVTWLLYATAWAITYGGVTDNLVVWLVFWTSQFTMLGYILMRDTSGTDDASRAVATADSASVTSTRTEETGMKRVRALHPFLWNRLANNES